MPQELVDAESGVAAIDLQRGSRARNRQGYASSKILELVRDLPLLGHERETYRTREHETRSSRGFFCLPGTHGKGQGVPLERPERPVHADWGRGIKDMAKACAEDGVVLLIRFMPIAADVSNARDWTQLEGWARDLESARANVRVARPIILPYDQSLMWDSIHINAAGVGKFMPTVARDVQAAIGRHDPTLYSSHCVPVTSRHFIRDSSEKPQIAKTTPHAGVLVLSRTTITSRDGNKGSPTSSRRLLASRH